MLARQLRFSIVSNGLSLGTLEPFDWGTIEAKDLIKPPSDARNLTLLHQANISSLFVDGLKPYKSESECNEQKCPTNCPDSERDVNGSFISRQRRALLCLNDTDLSNTFNFTCSVPCPAWKHAVPLIVWMKNDTLVHMTCLLSLKICNLYCHLKLVIERRSLESCWWRQPTFRLVYSDQRSPVTHTARSLSTCVTG